MTDIQKQAVISLREDGFGYKAIATKTGISVNSVKTFLRRNGSVPCSVDSRKTDMGEKHFCRNCGVEIHSLPGRKVKVFCSRECGLKWWHSHPDQLRRKACYSFKCAECGQEFTAYGNSRRKYCSISCSVKARKHRSGICV